jgi:hypothetical protein
MFQDLDATLTALLEKEFSIKNVTVSFATPDDQFPPSNVRLPAISFFLYDVRENYGLRSNQWETEQQPTGEFTRKRPPVRVDCSYLITAWPSATAPNPAQDEHRLLGEVMKVLLRHRTVPADYLQGELKTQEPPVRAKLIAENQLHSLGEFWQAMGGRPKATLHYAVTLSVDIFEPIPIGPAVKQKMIVSLTQGVTST